MRRTDQLLDSFAYPIMGKNPSRTELDVVKHFILLLTILLIMRDMDGGFCVWFKAMENSICQECICIRHKFQLVNSGNRN